MAELYLTPGDFRSLKQSYLSFKFHRTKCISHGTNHWFTILRNYSEISCGWKLRLAIVLIRLLGESFADSRPKNHGGLQIRKISNWNHFVMLRHLRASVLGSNPFWFNGVRNLQSSPTLEKSGLFPAALLIFGLLFSSLFSFCNMEVLPFLILYFFSLNTHLQRKNARPQPP